MKKILSIIILNYNTCKLTLDCLKSIKQDKTIPSYEIILVDNASSDGSCDKFRSLKWDNLRLLCNKVNLGFAKAVNQGIRLARGKSILLLNSDTIIKKAAINKLLDFAGKTSNAGVVGAKLLNPDGTVQSSCYFLPTLGRTILQYWLGKDKLLDKYAPKETKPTIVEAVVGASFLITPKALSKVGLLDERYFMYFEDLDYCRRVNRAGLKVYYLPEAEIIHFHGESGKTQASTDQQWRRLVPSSRLYHGIFKHFLISAIIWSGEKTKKLLQ